MNFHLPRLLYIGRRKEKSTIYIYRHNHVPHIHLLYYLFVEFLFHIYYCGGALRCTFRSQQMRPTNISIGIPLQSHHLLWNESNSSKWYPRVYHRSCTQKIYYTQISSLQKNRTHFLDLFSIYRYSNNNSLNRVVKGVFVSQCMCVASSHQRIRNIKGGKSHYIYDFSLSNNF